MNNFNPYIGFAIKSGKIIYGIDNILKSKPNKICLILYCDIKDNTTSKLIKFSQTNNIKLLSVNLKDLPTGVKIMGITEPNLAKIILEKMENLEGR